MQKQIAEHKERLDAARAQTVKKHEQAEAKRRAAHQEAQDVAAAYRKAQRQADARAAVQKDPRAVAAEQMVAHFRRSQTR